jgi:hypothetical protein
MVIDGGVGAAAPAVSAGTGTAAGATDGAAGASDLALDAARVRDATTGATDAAGCSAGTRDFAADPGPRTPVGRFLTVAELRLGPAETAAFSAPDASDFGDSADTTPAV